MTDTKVPGGPGPGTRQGDTPPNPRQPVRPRTPDRRTTLPDGTVRTTITLQRACNGCGALLGDVTDDEITRAVAGMPLPDVRAECPTCGGGRRPYRDERSRMWFVHTDGCGQVVTDATAERMRDGMCCAACDPLATRPPTPPAGWAQVFHGDPLPVVDLAVLRRIQDAAFAADVPAPGFPTGSDA